MSTEPQEMSTKFYPIPCMVTLASLFCGFYSIVSSINGDFRTAAIAIMVAWVFDGLDGRIARLTNSTSKFGMELDSLCDLVSFGVAPAVMAYLWALHPYGRYGWLAAFLFVATTALRLARFNSQDTLLTSKDFVGLPCPAAAFMIATSVLFCRFLGITGEVRHISLLLLVYLLSYLMVSTHRYLSFKKPKAEKARPFPTLVISLILFVLIAAEPDVMLFLLFLIYMLSGPTMALSQWIKRPGKASLFKKKQSDQPPSPQP